MSDTSSNNSDGVVPDSESEDFVQAPAAMPNNENIRAVEVKALKVLKKLESACAVTYEAVRHSHWPTALDKFNEVNELFDNNRILLVFKCVGIPNVYIRMLRDLMDDDDIAADDDAHAEHSGELKELRQLLKKRVKSFENHVKSCRVGPTEVGPAEDSSDSDSSDSDSDSSDSTCHRKGSTMKEDIAKMVEKCSRSTSESDLMGLFCHAAARKIRRSTPVVRAPRDNDTKREGDVRFGTGNPFDMLFELTDYSTDRALFLFCETLKAPSDFVKHFMSRLETMLNGSASNRLGHFHIIPRGSHNNGTALKIDYDIDFDLVLPRAVCTMESCDTAEKWKAMLEGLDGDIVNIGENSLLEVKERYLSYEVCLIEDTLPIQVDLFPKLIDKDGYLCGLAKGGAFDRRDPFPKQANKEEMSKEQISAVLLLKLWKYQENIYAKHEDPTPFNTKEKQLLLQKHRDWKKLVRKGDVVKQKGWKSWLSDESYNKRWNHFKYFDAFKSFYILIAVEWAELEMGSKPDLPETHPFYSRDWVISIMCVAVKYLCQACSRNKHPKFDYADGFLFEHASVDELVKVKRLLEGLLNDLLAFRTI